VADLRTWKCSLPRTLTAARDSASDVINDMPTIATSSAAAIVPEVQRASLGAPARGTPTSLWANERPPR
jgi:hypothetical protein